MTWHPLPTDFSFQEAEHVYTANGQTCLSVTQILAESGRVDTRFFLPIHAWRGSYIHKAMEFDNTDDLDDASVRPELMGYIEAGRRAKRELGLQVLETERKIWNPTWNYPGTLDFTALQRNGRLALIDWKSGAIGKWVRLQLAAYCAGALQPFLFDRIAIRLKPTAKYSCEFYGPDTLSADLNEFYRDILKVRNDRNGSIEKVA